MRIKETIKSIFAIIGVGFIIGMLMRFSGIKSIVPNIELTDDDFNDIRDDDFNGAQGRECHDDWKEVPIAG